MKRIITGLFAITALTFSAAAQNQEKTNDQQRMHHEGKGQHHGKDGKGMHGFEKLNLTEAQKQQIKAINQDFKNRLQALNGNDQALVKDAKSQRKALMQERKEKIAAILTPEQKIQFEQLRKEHGGKEGDLKAKTKGEDWKQKRKVEDGNEKVKVKNK